MIYWIILFSLHIPFSYLFAFADDSEELIRILLLDNVYKVEISSSYSSILVSDLDYKRILFKKNTSITPLIISPVPKGIRLDQQVIGLKALKISGKNLPIRVNRSNFRGSIEIWKKSNGTIQVINNLPIEEYLQGVMKTEVNPAWPIEALKAQAIAARTYALYHKQINEGKLTHLTCTINSQVYGGLSGEDDRSNVAVLETEGMILKNEKGELISAFYHACCGGKTEDAKYVFGDHHALKGVYCGFCSDSEHYRWKRTIPYELIKEKLNKKNILSGDILSIDVDIKKTSSKRVTKLVLNQTTGESIILKGTEFRKLIGYDVIRSLKFDIINGNSSITFIGNGWGHGVGLCQWGAKGMAENGYNYKQILKYYYPYTQVPTGIK
ncbi:MAG: SpoIID/LytB domain-containing protein [bacterium]